MARKKIKALLYAVGNEINSKVAQSESGIFLNEALLRGSPFGAEIQGNRKLTGSLLEVLRLRKSILIDKVISLTGAPDDYWITHAVKHRAAPMPVGWCLPAGAARMGSGKLNAASVDSVILMADAKKPQTMTNQAGQAAAAKPAPVRPALVEQGPARPAEDPASRLQMRLEPAPLYRPARETPFYAPNKQVEETVVVLRKRASRLNERADELVALENKARELVELKALVAEARDLQLDTAKSIVEMHKALVAGMQVLDNLEQTNMALAKLFARVEQESLSNAGGD